MEYLRVDDMWALWKLKRRYDRANPTSHLPPDATANQRYSYDILNRTSRSFAMVICELGPELRDAVAIFYLVLRGLDTVEDDSNFANAEKIPMLVEFHEYLERPGWTFSRCGEAHERELLQNFDKVIDVYQGLKPAYRAVISDITRRMGKGMSEFCVREVDTLDDWNLYCHYVAGLVGIGLSKLFAASGLEDASFADMDRLSNSMGLFLQKTNIIRDYLEDINEKRIFWPTQVWKMYSNKLEDFKEPANAQRALDCLNHLVTDALSHMPDCIEYMSKLKNQQIFNFCAIPQVMAAGTLAGCYNNHQVFTGVVKLSRAQSAKIIASSTDADAICRWFHHYAEVVRAKVPAHDPNRTKMLAVLRDTTALTADRAAHAASDWSFVDALTVVAVVGSVAWLVAGGRR